MRHAVEATAGSAVQRGAGNQADKLVKASPCFYPVQGLAVGLYHSTYRQPVTFFSLHLCLYTMYSEKFCTCACVDDEWACRGLTACILIEAARRAFGRTAEFAEHAGQPFRDLWWDGQQVAYRERAPALL